MPSTLISREVRKTVNCKYQVIHINNKAKLSYSLSRIRRANHGEHEQIPATKTREMVAMWTDSRIRQSGLDQDQVASATEQGERNGGRCVAWVAVLRSPVRPVAGGMTSDDDSTRARLRDWELGVGGGDYVKLRTHLVRAWEECETKRLLDLGT